jgi:DNA-binding response OmpR family regulator
MGNCNINDFTTYISTIYGRMISKKCIVVGINRLRRKVITQTGYDFLKTIYGYGYTIRY